MQCDSFLNISGADALLEMGQYALPPNEYIQYS